MGAHFEVIEVGHQANHLVCTLDAQVRVLVEQLKEFALGGHETSKHGFLRYCELILLNVTADDGGVMI
jgi:hypothetical protein